ncbi:pre-mRNA splicing factor component-domain-containing protein [Roridomyces roridus]|uniref:Pre-mRNA-splicing factor CEF1 n=1 Tax=Roridomyces roridus TaxID=1738132 RepID=A0AAD7BVX3_9AGAR|nr:pre-mRNA splicing factor component-domain-containing protein [Roridomyces roridus]
MVRIIIKGGVWKNTEDEVLKAAIAKYGKNQWARISSLLVRKTPKQCKARWYEWLDPSIKKTEWSKTEDEKLLHLAKLMPTQWRTIAPIVGRTAVQCLERYQKLLDEAEAKENEELGLTGPDGDSGPSADDIRRLRPGEIDPDPETKPARPDPIDMDEDEKEMLSEARARLANTQGKKAKRKARERQLEEARRLAVLQKRRELKAAGIMQQKRKGMDYNADIPFEKKAAAGFYDTSEEQARIAAAPVGQTLRRLENKRKPAEEEEAERKKRQRKNGPGKEGEGSGHQTKFIAARDAQIQKLKEAESIGRRRKLMLPTAQVGEAELEDIVKIGQAGESAKALARNLRNMSMAQTPLLGDENTPLHSATPRHQVSFTPNPLATPLRADGLDGSATPRSISATPLRTPMRDNLAINGETPREERIRANSAKRALQAGFMNLPAPENNFELLVPEEDEEENPGTDGAALSEEDAAERDAKLRRSREEAERKALARRSQALNLGEDAEAQRLINKELADLLQHDAIAYPIPGTSRVGASVSSYDMPADDDVDAAKALIHTELAATVGFTSVSPEQLREGLFALVKADTVDETTSWAFTRQQLTYDAASKMWVEPTSLSAEDRVKGYEALIQERRELMGKEAARAAKVEKKLQVVLGGYLARSDALSKRITSAFEEMQKTQVDYNSFSRLHANESAVGPRRLEALKEEVDTLERRERRLQERYAELEAERRDSQERVQALEEKLMEDAEALNEAQLAAMEEDES